jgi:hypothetical protein
MSSRLFLSVREELGLAYDVSSGLVDYADAGAVEVSAGVDPDGLPAALDAILAELDRLRREDVPEAELEKAKAYLSGGLELRMDETRHLASWIGGQEALHDRVMTLEEALAEVAAVTSADVRRVAGELFTTRGCGSRSWRPRSTPGGSSAGCGCPRDATYAPSTPADADERGADLVLARVISGWGRWARPGRAGGARRPQRPRRRGDPRPGRRPLANRRPARAGEAAAAYLETKPDDALCLVISAELQASLGRPGEARRLAGKALTKSNEPVDRIFAGMPRSPIWPIDPGAPVEPVGTLFTDLPAQTRPDIGLPAESFLDGRGARPRPTRRLARRAGWSGLWDAHGGALAATLPSATELLARSRAAVEGGRPGQAAAASRSRSAPTRRSRPRSSTCSPGRRSRSSRSSAATPTGSWATRPRRCATTAARRGDEPRAKLATAARASDTARHPASDGAGTEQTRGDPRPGWG